MPSTRVVPDHVWAQLDPRAGRLSRRERWIGLALVAAVLIVLGLAITADKAGVLAPSVDGEMFEGQVKSATHQVVLHVRVSNDSAVSAHVSSIATSGNAFGLRARPSSFALSAHASRDVRLFVAVRDCAAVTRNSVVPITVVTEQWWGHLSHALLAPGEQGLTQDQIFYEACHGI